MNTFEFQNPSKSEIIKIEENQYNKEIKKAEKDIQKGDFYNHNEVKSKIDQWKQNSKIL